MPGFEVRVLPEDKPVVAEAGVSLKHALAAAFIPLRGNCGGKGACGQCRVRVGSEWVLSCLYTVDRDITVWVPEYSRAPRDEPLRDAAYDARYAGRPHEVCVRPEPAASGPLHLAVVIGTTTLSLALVDAYGKTVSEHRMFNPQVVFGEDVISRIIYAEENPGGLLEMRHSVTSEINRHVRAMCKGIRLVASLDVKSATVAGNTTMLHILLGRDIAPIRREALALEALRGVVGRAEEFGLGLGPGALVTVLPQVSCFVGGDVVSGVLASGMAESDDVRLLVDIGTNGELVLGSRQWMVGCACSAGPAFEGGGVTWGMPAVAGAIERVDIDPITLAPSARTIGGGTPFGICGSGLISALSALLGTGLIDRSGRFGGHAKGFVLAESSAGEMIVLTEADVANLIRAKAALYAGARTLLRATGLCWQDLCEILVAGGFGNSLDLERAVSIGLLPDLDRKVFRFVGNTSLEGAKRAARYPDDAAEAERTARSITYIDLAQDHSFLDEFVAASFLPHTDMAQFPTAARGRLEPAP